MSRTLTQVIQYEVSEDEMEWTVKQVFSEDMHHVWAEDSKHRNSLDAARRPQLLSEMSLGSSREVTAVQERMARRRKREEERKFALREAGNTINLTRAFFGMRDYYSVIKHLAREAELKSKKKRDSETDARRGLGRKGSAIRFRRFSLPRKLSSQVSQRMAAYFHGQDTNATQQGGNEPPNTGGAYTVLPITDVATLGSTVYAICRNFGGHELLLQHILREGRLYNHLQSGALRNDRKLEMSDSVTELVRENLHDHKSRHLMLLTESSAALRLLFSQKLLRRKNEGGEETMRQAVVLEGSPFNGDVSQMQLLKDVNKVKNAMRTGDTIVLLNYDGVYEALYEVLNQSCLVRKGKPTFDVEVETSWAEYIRLPGVAGDDGVIAVKGKLVEKAERMLDPRKEYEVKFELSQGVKTEKILGFRLKLTGEHSQERKFLRLAVGTRSQQCRVSKGFRVVLVVERHQAYHELDLPLLNRFEKQVMLAENVLSAACAKSPDIKGWHKELVAWMEKVKFECASSGDNAPAPAVKIEMGDIFIGASNDDDSTSAMLLLNGIASGDGRVEISCLQQTLLHTAHPMCVELSETLRNLLNGSDGCYFDRHGSLRSLLHWLDDENKERRPIKAVVATHSPPRHLADDLSFLGPGFETDKFIMRKLHEFSSSSSEYSASSELRSRLWADFFEPSNEKKCLLVQCDLSQENCTRATVDYTRRLCENLAQEAEAETEAGGHNSEPSLRAPRRDVVFIIHCPLQKKKIPAENRYKLEFEHGWRHFFVPELEDAGKSSTEDAIKLPPSSFPHFKMYKDKARACRRNGPSLTDLYKDFESGAVIEEIIDQLGLMTEPDRVLLLTEELRRGVRNFLREGKESALRALRGNFWDSNISDAVSPNWGQIVPAATLDIEVSQIGTLLERLLAEVGGAATRIDAIEEIKEKVNNNSGVDQHWPEQSELEGPELDCLSYFVKGLTAEEKEILVEVMKSFILKHGEMVKPQEPLKQWLR
jgi:hypothetical protein